jgi:hypothetical protein
MRKVTVITTNNSQVNQFEIEAGVSTFSQLVSALPAVDFSNKTVTVGKALYSLEHADAILPDGNLKVFISPKDMKAAFPSEYYTLRDYLKAARITAIEGEDDEILDIIGNYTHDSINVMAAKKADVEEVMDARAEDEEEDVLSDDDVTYSSFANLLGAVSTAGIESRLFEVEYQLGIRNPANAARFNAKALEEAQHATKKA